MIRPATITRYHFQFLLCKKVFFDERFSSFIVDKRIFLISKPCPIKPNTKSATATNGNICSMEYNRYQPNFKLPGLPPFSYERSWQDMDEWKTCTIQGC